MVLVADRHMSDVFFIDGGAKQGALWSWSQIGICRTCFLLMVEQNRVHCGPGLR